MTHSDWWKKTALCSPGITLFSEAFPPQVNGVVRTQGERVRYLRSRSRPNRTDADLLTLPVTMLPLGRKSTPSRNTGPTTLTLKRVPAGE